MPIEKSPGPIRALQRLIRGRGRLKQLRAAGDHARDSKDWIRAVEKYRDFLASVPSDAAIWVQYGHALKEIGSFTDAEAAYTTAARLDPNDVDVRLHLAHLLKRQDRRSGAADMFLEVLNLSPNAEVMQELNEVGYSSHARSAFQFRPTGLPSGSVFIELKDLFQYLNMHTTVTGITRVTLGLINHLLHEMSEKEASRYHFVQQYDDGQGVIFITKAHMTKIVAAAISSNPDLTGMRSLISEIRSTSRLFKLEAGDTYLIIGAFWEFVSNPSWIGGMRQQGVLIGAYIYDLIPISHAQYCVQELTEAFNLAFAETARLLDFALTISAFIAQEVLEYLQAKDIPVFPIIPVPLAHSLHFEKRAVTRNVPMPPERQYLSGIPFVLCVCTIEARKNHVYLFDIWRRMIDDGIDVPDLVFVGRLGWRVEALIEQIEEANYLDGRIHILFGLSDEELADLYDRCLFTAFPSFVEGWGLPVGESLAHGKLCVASSASAIPEVGGDQVIYVDPFDIEDGYATIAGLVTDPDRIRRLETRLRASFKPRTWTDVGKDFFLSVETLMADAASSQAGAVRRLFAPYLPATQLLETSKLSRTTLRGSSYARNPKRLIFVLGWRDVERTGTWMHDPQTLVIVQTDCAPATRGHCRAASQRISLGARAQRPNYRCRRSRRRGKTPRRRSVSSPFEGGCRILGRDQGADGRARATGRQAGS